MDQNHLFLFYVWIFNINNCYIVLIAFKWHLAMENFLELTCSRRLKFILRVWLWRFDVLVFKLLLISFLSLINAIIMNSLETKKITFNENGKSIEVPALVSCNK